MKKTLLSVIAIIAILLTFSFTSANNENEITIKVTSEKSITFDMVQNGKVVKGIKTPYEFKFNEKNGNFIFKANDEKKLLKLDVVNKNGNLNAKWNIIVLTIENDKMSTFGM
jgi:hypothetical protein